MTPTVDGGVTYFRTVGIFNGLSMLKDEATESVWNHITGEAVYGPKKGERLPIYNLLHTTVRGALEADPEVSFAMSDRPIRRMPGLRDRMRSLRPGFRSTIVKEDTRRPTMELGLGVWTDSEARYYPMETVEANGGALIDHFDGRSLLVYLEAGFGGLVALFVESATATAEDSSVQLDGGLAVRGGVLVDAEGERVEIVRPMQMFTRWYGFSLTFTETTIYGG